MFMDISTPLKQITGMLDAVREKNHQDFLRFFHKEQKIFGIFPHGKRALGYDSFIESQNEWFRSREGRFDYSIVRKNVGSDMAHFGVDVDFLSPEKVHLKLYIGILLKFYAGSWHFVHFQNTVIEK